MAYELKEGSGAIFKNDKRGNEKAPDYNGNAMIDGKEVKIALWVREGSKGKFFSVKIEHAVKKAEASSVSKKSPQEDDSDGLPF